MSDKLQLLIPGAVLASDEGEAPSPGLPALPHLRALLTEMAPAQRVECGPESPSTPFELALAHARGVPGEAGFIPWAAFETGTTGMPCAWVKLCHWQVGADHVMLSPPQELALDEATATALLGAMRPYFEEDGIALQPWGDVPGVWLATGEPLRHLRTVSMERLAGQRLTPALLDAAAALRRLQNEMQMLLYTHAANDERQRQGKKPVNSFWIGGAGVLERQPSPVAGLRVEPRLQASAARRDADAHALAWQAVDADTCAALLAVLRAGGEARLTLCGEKAAQSFEPAKTGFFRKLQRQIGLQPAWNGGQQL